MISILFPFSKDYCCLGLCIHNHDLYTTLDSMNSTPMHSGESLFPNICGLPLLLFFWLKWAGYLAVAGLNLLAQISDRISPDSV